MATGTVLVTVWCVLLNLEDWGDCSFWKGTLSLGFENGLVRVADRKLVDDDLLVKLDADAGTLADRAPMVLELMAVWFGDLAFTGCARAVAERFVH